jgi:uncharacterized protein YwgA
MPESFRLLAAVIGAHQNHTVNGRTRLQKTVKLLQSLGYPTNYDFRLFFYGPYSEDVWFDLRLLERLGLAEEEEMASENGKDNPWYKISVKPDAVEEALAKDWSDAIRRMEGTDLVALELAATYDSFRELGSGHADALVRLKRKKGTKCSEKNLAASISLLNVLALPVV